MKVEENEDLYSVEKPNELNEQIPNKQESSPGLSKTSGTRSPEHTPFKIDDLKSILEEASFEGTNENSLHESLKTDSDISDDCDGFLNNPSSLS